MDEIVRIDLAEVIETVTKFRTALISRSDLEAQLAERVLTPPPRDSEVEPATDSQALAYAIAQHVCSTQGSDEDLMSFLRRVLVCLEQVREPDIALDLLPLIIYHDEFSVLVLKHARGVISSTGIKSVITKRFHFDAHYEWLAEAPVDRLLTLTELLEADDYHGLHALLTST